MKATWKPILAISRPQSVKAEEHSISLMDIVYRTFFILSMLTTYQRTVTTIESQAGVTLEAAQNRLLEEWWKVQRWRIVDDGVA